jgi:hypothetical protein
MAGPAPSCRAALVAAMPTNQHVTNRSADMNVTSIDSDVWGWPPEETALRQWITAWFYFAVNEGYIEPQYELNDATAVRLEGYFQAGITPSEGADLIFGMVH